MKISEIAVDNMEIPVSQVLPFYQKEPYPGGHTFRLKLSFDNENTLNEFFKVNKLEDIHNASSSRFFLKLSTQWPDKENAQFFINTVTEIIKKDLTIELSGVCSPVVRT